MTTEFEERASDESRTKARHDFPRGWFVVALADELAGDVPTRLRYFGRELIGFRDASGAPTVLDAFCPHLGAHLGHGGTIVDGAVRCPFHAWTFDGTGRCIDVPYAKQIPKRAAIRAYPTVERNGFVFVHFDPDEREPTFEIPVMAEVGDPGWTPWKHGRLVMKTHSREILENVVDVAHFAPVHKNVPAQFTNEFVGHRAIQHSIGHGMGEHATTGYDLTATYHGPGFQITEMSSVVETRLYNAHTMIDDNLVDLRFGIMFRVGSHQGRFSDAYVADYVDVVMHGFQQDARIWEHKRYRERPVLCDGDGPIAQLRAWYAQFYAR